MKKNIITIIIAIMFTTSLVYAETIIDSEYVTYESEKTDQIHVRGALDELIEKVDNINTGGDALASDITKGKTAYIQGKLITGTKKETTPYWSSIYQGAMIDEKDVNYSVDWVGGLCVLRVLYGENQSLTIKSCTAGQEIYYTRLYQISPDVVGLYWSLKETVSETESNTDTTYSRTDSYYYIDYFTTFIVKNGSLTKVEETAVGPGGSTTTSPFVNQYYKDSYSYTNEKGTITDRWLYQNNFYETMYSGYDKNLVYYAVESIYTERYYAYGNNSVSTSDKTTDGFWYNTLSVNVYTGDITLGTSASYTTIYYDDPEKRYYDSVYGYEFTKFGINRITYTDTYHNEVKAYSFYDYYGTTKKTVTSDTTDNGLKVRKLPHMYSFTSNYGFSASFNVKSSRTLGVTINSSKMGDSTSDAAYFLATADYRTENISYNLSDILPTGVTMSTASYLFSTEDRKIYLTITCSNGGYVFVILGISDVDYIKGNGLKPVLLSANYRTKLDGTLTSTKRINTDRGLNFYM